MLHTSMKEIVKCTVARRQQTATQTDRHTDIERGTQTDKHTDIERGTQTDKHTDIERGTQTDKHAYSPHNSVETYRFTH